MTAAPVFPDVPPAGRREYSWNVLSYRSVLGWEVGLRDGGAVLIVGRGLVAVIAEVPAALQAMERLEAVGVEGPVVAVGGQRPYWAFLADPNEEVRSTADLPHGVALIGCGGELPLPIRGGLPSGPRWVSAPDRKIGLPTLGAVMLGFQHGPRSW
ncbi:hypothetical protein ACPZ19_42810 [Amycolatopsis lurida]